MTSSPAAHEPSVADRALKPGLALLAAIHLGTAAWMVVAPESFFERVGPFGVYNPHYLGDAAAFTGGIGLALAASLAWAMLRSGALAVAAAATGLHAFNHWLDVGDAHAGSNAGVVDAVTLTLQFALTVALLAAAVRRSGAP